MANFSAVPFSARYTLVKDVDVLTYNEERAIIDSTLFEALQDYFGADFLSMIGGQHYDLMPVNAIPRNTVAVPSSNHDDPGALLVQHD